MLTALTSDMDRVLTLEMGDDE
ncbi:conserved protein of unknown function [Ectopseudomonas oleovorans]|uniref:Uncharacterized protein n=1 Tax=Ectopseudomonas oleovorans TaxID=301 RepID=A0A653AZJ3_ECTOL|nr:conserved protein of unknown function [Pseudomonas oleovorans]